MARGKYSPVGGEGDVELHADVVSMAQPLDAMACIYFLVRDDRVVYVGQSINAMNRIRQHINERTKKFDRWHFIAVKREKLNETEMEYILALRPEYNVQLPEPPLSSFEQLCAAVEGLSTEVESAA